MITEATIVSLIRRRFKTGARLSRGASATTRSRHATSSCSGSHPRAGWPGPGASPDESVSHHELLRATLLAPRPGEPSTSTRPPPTRRVRLVCPKCGSSHPAPTCRACNTPRLNQAVEKPWTNSAEVCKRWNEEAIAKGLIPVPGKLTESNDRILTEIRADSHCEALLQGSLKLLEVTGTWVGEDPKNPVPVRALIDIAPQPNHALCGTLATVKLLTDISPGAWQGQMVRGGYHIQEALARQLFEAATGEVIQHQLWLLVEGRQPHIVGRRRSTPELDVLGRTTCDRLLERMAFCRKWNLWPTFDPLCSGALPAWSETFLEEWMTQGGAGSTGYWAVDGVDRIRQPNEDLHEAA